MRRPTPRAIITALSVIPLFYLYIQLAGTFLARQNLLPSTTFEGTIFLLQVLKLIAILTVRRLRYASYALIMDLFLIEPLALPVIAVFNIASGTGYLSPLAESLFLTGIASVALVLPIYMMFRILVGMLRGASLVSVVPAVTAVAGSMLFFTGTAASAPQSAVGLAGFGQSMFSFAASGVAASPYFPNLPSVAAMVSIYVSLLLYTGPVGTEGGLSRLNITMAVMGAATVAVFIWVYLAFLLTTETLLIFVAPTVALSSLAWWYSREP